MEEELIIHILWTIKNNDNDNNNDTYTNDNTERHCVGSSFLFPPKNVTIYAAYSNDKQTHFSRKKETPIFQ